MRIVDPTHDIVTHPEPPHRHARAEPGVVSEQSAVDPAGTGAAATAPTSEWRSGWALVLAACAGMSWTSLVFSTIGLFVLPLQAEFGWSRTIATSGLAIVATLSVLLSPVIGMMIDRIGPRRIGIFGVIVFAISYSALALAQRQTWSWWLLWLCVGLGAVTVKPTVWTAAIVSRFTSARGLAMAVALSGTSITGIVAPLIAGYLISAFGWRTGFAGVGLLWLLVTLPPVLLFFFGGADRGRDRRIASTAARDRPLPSGVEVRVALRSATYFKLAIASTLIIVTLIPATVHFVPFVRSRGLGPSFAAISASVIGMASLAGRLGSGYLLDRVDARRFGALAFGLPSIGFMLLATLQTTPEVAFVGAALVGLGSGAEIQIAAFLTARIFGLRHYGVLFGILAGLIAFAGGVSPALVGYIYDRTGTYTGALWCGVALSIFAALLIASIDDRRSATPSN